MIALLLCLTLNVLGEFSSDDLHASFWANYTGFGQKHAQAFAWYKKYLCKQNTPGYMYRGLLHLFKQTNNLKQIIALMPLVEQAFEHDVEMQMIFIHALQETGNELGCEERIIKLASKIKDNQELSFLAAQTFIKRKEPENALSTINDYLLHAGNRLNNFIFHFLKAQIYISLGKTSDALGELQKSLELHPTFDKGWLLYGLLQEQSGNLKKAIKGYKQFLETTDQPIPHIHEHLLRLLLKQKTQTQTQSALPTEPVSLDDIIRARNPHELVRLETHHLFRYKVNTY